MAELDGVGSDLDRWLEPFLAALGHKKRRTWAPMYLRGRRWTSYPLSSAR